MSKKEAGIYSVTIVDTGERYRCNGNDSLLLALARTGRRGIPVGCRGGGCGVCKVAVLSGAYRKRVMSRVHVSEEDEAAHRVLACCIYPESDVHLSVIGKMQKVVCRKF